ncbi:HipA N-terminal domain-containing protein [Butyrivibrio sp. LC3010]|uniref:HipA N-terminal domain-containing protein n=1 Tax=Butyrivibrio sp. LC3010 TaxID=1280680 RepID=UPI00047C7E83|nr:HipA N-terminal domain-containing protein [Butyrivibrio sp. LC3010]
MSRIGKVYVQGIPVGEISEEDDGYLFKYYESYLQNEGALAVSLTLPLQSEEYKSNVLFPFFDGLIPEGWLLNVVERNWKVDSKDRFGLMLASCRDCIGDVCVEAVE